MAISTFDTLEFVRRLEQSGVPANQAEVQAQLLTEVCTMNRDQLVTKDYLAAQLAEFRADFDVKFARLKADFDVKLRVQTVMLGIVMAAVVLPLLERLVMS